MKKVSKTISKESKQAEKISQVRSELIKILELSNNIYDNNQYLEKLIEYISIAVSNYRKLIESKLEETEPSSKGEEREAIKFFREDQNDHEILYIDRLMNKFTERQELFKKCLITSEEIENLEESKNIDGYEIVFTNEVNTPPDEMDEKFFTGGEYEQIEGENQERLASILFLLKKKRVKPKDITIYFGKNEENMIRDETYRTIYLKKLEKLIFVCNEYGNATFVMDKDKSKEVIDYIRMTKNEKHEEGAKWIKWNEDLGKWLSEVEDSVFGEINLIKEEKKLKQVEKDNDIPQVAKEGEWRGFWTDEEGRHWGAQQAIINKLDITYRKMKKVICDFVSKKISNAQDVEVDGYCYEDLYERFKIYLALTKVDTTGEWRGFWADEEGKHWGGIKTIASRLNIGAPKIRKVIEFMNTIKLKNIKGLEINAYCYESVSGYLEDYMSAEQVEKKGEWIGFCEDENGQHWGAVRTIANGMNVPEGVVYKFTKQKEGKKIKDVLGHMIDGYSYEEISGSVCTYLAFPQVDINGEWKGFWEDEDRNHWGAKNTILKRLEIGAYTMNNLVKEMNVKQGRSISDTAIDMYCYEEVKKKASSYNDIADVLTSGEWQEFWKDKDEKHWGSKFAIEQKMKVSNHLLRSLLPKMDPKMIKGSGGQFKKAYCLEDVVEKLKAENKS